MESFMTTCARSSANRSTKPGCRFVTLNENNGRAANGSEEVTEGYGFRWRAPVWPLNDGDPIVITLLHGASQATFTIRYFCRDTYEWALREAGLPGRPLA
ncbi:MAG TPA: hypothetical protein VHT91_17355 [Kofleriaceae bacterium]|jgi:hypothetical protein|nr:hypothetical protein [Kofleriaceae bacterium]